MEKISGWFAGRLPDGWFEGPPAVETDREEILVVGALADVEVGSDSPEALSAARSARIQRFREETRRQRMAIADEAQSLFRRKVSWGARCGDVEQHFTTLALPVMTRLRKRERAVLDTLVESGVARSRSHALAWCVHLVGQHESDWIDKLREALTEVEKVRAEGPA